MASININISTTQLPSTQRGTAVVPTSAYRKKNWEMTLHEKLNIEDILYLFQVFFFFFPLAVTWQNLLIFRVFTRFYKENPRKLWKISAKLKIHEKIPTNFNLVKKSPGSGIYPRSGQLCSQEQHIQNSPSHSLSQIFVWEGGDVRQIFFLCE